MWLYNTETLQIVEINDAAIDKYGYSKDEFLSLTIKDIRPLEDHNKIEESVKKMVAGLNNSKWMHKKKSDELFPVSIISHTVCYNDQPCNMVMATDMSEIYANEQKLEEAYRKEKALNDELEKNIDIIKKANEESHRMAEVIDKINNHVLIINDQRTISWANQAFIEFTGYSLEEIVGKRPQDLLFGPKTDPNTFKSLINSITKKVSFSGEIVNYKKCGEAYWVQLNLSPIFDKEGNFEFYISIENVITERKEKEQKINEQNTALRRIAWSNSHELRRPLCSILSLIILLKDTDSTEEREKYLAFLEKSSMELDQTLKNINNLNVLAIDFKG